MEKRKWVVILGKTVLKLKIGKRAKCCCQGKCFVCYLIIRLRARVFYEQIVNEAQLPNPCWMEDNINKMKSNFLSFLLHSTINCMTLKFFWFCIMFLSVSLLYLRSRPWSCRLWELTQDALSCVLPLRKNSTPQYQTKCKKWQHVNILCYKVFFTWRHSSHVGVPMQTFSLVLVENHANWSHEWKHSLLYKMFIFWLTTVSYSINFTARL